MIGLVLFVAFIMIGIEHRFKRQDWPHAKWWWLRALGLNSVQMILSLVTGTYLDKLLGNYSLFYCQFAPWLQVVLGYLSITYHYFRKPDALCPLLPVELRSRFSA